MYFELFVSNEQHEVGGFKDGCRLHTESDSDDSVHECLLCCLNEGVAGSGFCLLEFCDAGLIDGRRFKLV